MPRDRAGPLATGLLVSRAGRPSTASRIALALIAGVVAGTAFGAVAAARWSDGSADRFARWYRPEDLKVVADPAFPPGKALAVLDEVRGMPEVDAAVRDAVLVTRVHVGAGPARSARGAMVVEASIDPPVAGVARARVIRGRLADPERPDEIAVNERLADLLDVGLGDRVTLDLFRADQLDEIGNGIGGRPLVSPSPRIVGIVRRPYDLERSPESQDGNLEEFNDAHLYTTPAFWRAHGPGLALYGFESRVRLRGGPGTEARFAREVQATGEMITLPPDVYHDVDVVRRSTTTEAVALLCFAGLVGVVGFVLVGAAVRRSVELDPRDVVVCRALGARRRDLVVAELARAGPIVLAAAALSVPVALFVAPRAMFGLSRQAEVGSISGVALSTALVLAVGLVAVSVLAVALVGFASARSDERRSAPVGAAPRAGGPILGWLSRTGAPPWTVAGVRMAFPLPGRSGTVVRSALATITVGVALLVATTIFGSSLHHVLTTPDARGWTWDLNVGNYADAAQSAAGARALGSNPDVDSFTGFDTQELPIDGETVDVLGVDDMGVLDLPVASGQSPSGPGEIALTRPTARSLGVEVGDTVRVTGYDGSRKRFRVVGEMIGPGAVANDLDLRTGGIMRWDDLRSLVPPSTVLEQYAVRFRDGVDLPEATRRLRPSFGLAVFQPAATYGVASIERVQPLLLLFAATVLVLAGGALVHALVVALRRRRREVALLKALGFDRRQVGRTVVLQAVSLAALGVAVGVPVGVILGRWAWRYAAGAIGVLSGPTLPVAVPVAVVAVLVTAAVASLVPARRAQVVAAGEILRAE